MIAKEKPGSAGGREPGLCMNLQSNDSKPPLKWKRVLRALLDGRSFNRFEAERQLADHCLHSTVSTIQGKGVAIKRRTEKVPGFQGIPTEVRRYWIAPEARQRAREILGMVESSGGTESPPEAVLAASWAVADMPTAAGCAR